MAKSDILFGAKIAVNFRNNNICTKEECERLLSFTNNSGPLFIIGTCRNKFIWQLYNWNVIIYNTYFRKYNSWNYI